MKALMVILAVYSLCNAAYGQADHTLVGPLELKSNIYPGTTRNYWVYIPKQYTPTQPACLLVVQDGLSRATGWNMLHTLDSLIAAGSVPVTIGVFVDPGIVASSREGAFPRFNRSLEYDALGDQYATFLDKELLPEIQKAYNINPDPDSHSIAGASSGAICAFNVAWERPDLFRRVLSTIGTYVGLRGGDEFATLVRKTEAKPIRVFLEDGNNDLNIYAGDWWTANQGMLSALTYAGYEVNHSWGAGGHDSKHAATIMTEALTWLWKDYPQKVTTHKGVKPRIDLLIDGEEWHEVNGLSHPVKRISVDKNGNILFVDQQQVFQVDEQLKAHILTTPPVDLIAPGSSVLYGVLQKSRKLIAIDDSGKASVLANQVDADDLCATAMGLYISDKKNHRIGYYDFSQKTIRYYKVDFIPGAMTVTAEKTFLMVATNDSPFGYSFRINTDGGIQDGQPFVHYHIPYGSLHAGLGGVDVDQHNVLFSATQLGIQVADQLGRVNFIFSKAAQQVTDVKIAGDRLFMIGDGRLFVRKVTTKGIRSFGEPVTPPKPQL